MEDRAASEAVILAFPPREAAMARLRLQRSLDGLARALEEQRQAMREWRGALDKLSAAASDLHGSLRRQERTLTGLAQRVASLGEQASLTVRWSDTLTAL